MPFICSPIQILILGDLIQKTNCQACIVFIISHPVIKHYMPGRSLVTLISGSIDPSQNAHGRLLGDFQRSPTECHTLIFFNEPVLNTLQSGFIMNIIILYTTDTSLLSKHAQKECQVSIKKFHSIFFVKNWGKPSQVEKLTFFKCYQFRKVR